MSSQSERWWDRKEHPDPGELVYTIGSRLWNSVGKRRRAWAMDYLTLYLGSATGVGQMLSSLGLAAAEEPPAYNLCSAMVDTLASLIAHTRIRPFYQTEHKYELREKAEGMSRFTEAELREARIYAETGLGLVLDGLIFDGACALVQPDYVNKRLVTRRVWPWEVNVPGRDAANGSVRQKFVRQLIDRQVLLEMLDDKDARKLVEDAPVAPRDADADDGDTEGDVDSNIVSDLVEIHMAWHLPSTYVDLEDEKNFGIGESGRTVKADHDGRAVIAIGGSPGGTLQDHPWPFDYFPVPDWRPRPVPRSYWSRSTVGMLYSAQCAINRMDARVDDILHHHGRPLLGVWRRANVSQPISNGTTDVLETDVPPSQAFFHMAPNAVPGEYLQYRSSIIAWCKELLGVSDQTIQANRPPGIDHAPAMQHLRELESVRQSPMLRSWEQFIVDLSRAMVDAVSMLARHVPDYAVMWGDAKDLERLEWGKIALKRNQYHLTTHGTNLFATSPSAKMSQLFALQDRGVFTPEQVAEEFESPDVAARLGDINARRKNIKRILDDLAKNGEEAVERSTPDSYLALEMARDMAVDYINARMNDGLAEDKLDLIRTWHSDVEQKILEIENEKALAAQGMLPPQPNPAAAMGAPPGMPPTNGAMGPAEGMPAPPLPIQPAPPA